MNTILFLQRVSASLSYLLAGSLDQSPCPLSAGQFPLEVVDRIPWPFALFALVAGLCVQ